MGEGTPTPLPLSTRARPWGVVRPRWRRTIGRGATSESRQRRRRMSSWASASPSTAPPAPTAAMLGDAGPGLGGAGGPGAPARCSLSLRRPASKGQGSGPPELSLARFLCEIPKASRLMSQQCCSGHCLNLTGNKQRAPAQLVPQFDLLISQKYTSANSRQPAWLGKVLPA